MHFVRRIIQNKGSVDVRCRSYYVYKCTVCGHEHYFDWVKNFDTIRLRKCPGCGVTDDTNEKEYLIKKQHDIEQEIKSCQERLKVLNVGLLEVTEKLKNIPEVCNVST